MRSRILIPIVALVVAIQACCCCTLLGGPQPPYPITPSDEAIRRFEERMNSATPGPDGTFTITVTDEEITSLVARRLTEQQGEALPISDPQVYFRNGRIESYATLQLAGSLPVPCMVALSIAVENGLPIVTIEEIDAGPLPLPASFAEGLTDAVNQQLAESFASEAAGFAITDVQIGEGQMTVTAKATPGG
jgi:hypothetical protein